MESNLESSNVLRFTGWCWFHTFRPFQCHFSSSCVSNFRCVGTLLALEFCLNVPPPFYCAPLSAVSVDLGTFACFFLIRLPFHMTQMANLLWDEQDATNSNTFLLLRHWHTPANSEYHGMLFIQMSAETCSARTVIELSYFIVKHSPVTCHCHCQGSESWSSTRSNAEFIHIIQIGSGGGQQKSLGTCLIPLFFSASPNWTVNIFAVCCEIEEMLEDFEQPAVESVLLLYLLSPLIFICRWIMLTHSHLPASVVFSKVEVLWILSEKENYHRFSSKSRERGWKEGKMAGEEIRLMLYTDSS